MKKCILLLLSAAIPFLSEAQAALTVSPGTNFFIKPSTIVYAAGLTLVPSSAYTLSNVTLIKNSTLHYASANPSINRSYYFSNIMPAFSGVIQVEYRTAELNGLSELLLQPNIHNGSNWQAYASSLNDIINHNVISAVFASTALSEITLANMFSPLSIGWGNVTAIRKSQQNEISWTTNQEQGVDHFDIEYSTDMKNWVLAIRGIAASNQSTAHRYQQWDPVYKPQHLLYRVVETDADGRVSYSAAVALPAVDQPSLVNVYPNPSADRFYISLPGAAAVANVDLYASNGALVKRWPEAQAAYNIAALAPGVYIVSIKTTSGLSQTSRLVVR